MLSHRLGSSKRDDAFRPHRFQWGVHKCQRLDPVVTATENMPGLKAVGDHLIWARMGLAQEHGMKLLRSHDVMDIAPATGEGSADLPVAKRYPYSIFGHCDPSSALLHRCGALRGKLINNQTILFVLRTPTSFASVAHTYYCDHAAANVFPASATAPCVAPLTPPEDEVLPDACASR